MISLYLIVLLIQGFFKLLSHPVGWLVLIMIAIMCGIYTENYPAVIFLILVVGGFFFAVEKASAAEEKEKEKNAKKRERIKYANVTINSDGTAQGFTIGKKGTRVIGKAETTDGHILVVGGAGSGKSYSIAIPSLLTWSKRVLVIDIKGELHEATKHIRLKIKVFNPNDDRALGYNPFHLLDYIPKDNLTGEVTAIVMALFSTPADKSDSPFWIKSAQSMLIGAILHFYVDGLSFTETIDEILLTPVEKLVKIISESKNKDARRFVNQFVGMDAKTLYGVFAELHTQIVFYTSDKEIMKCLTNENYIKPTDLEKGSDIYIIISEHLLRRPQWKSLLTLMITQFLAHFEQRPDKVSTPILFMLDEFARLGKMEGITDALATLRSRNITICLVLQSLRQLDMIYSEVERQVICDNCSYQAILKARDARTQQEFSQLVGTYERKRETVTEQVDRWGIKTGESKGEIIEEKFIIKPESWATLQNVVLLTDYGYFRVDRASKNVLEQIEKEWKQEEQEKQKKESESSKRNKRKASVLKHYELTAYMEYLKQRSVLQKILRKRMTEQEFVRCVWSDYQIYKKYFNPPMTEHEFMCRTDKEYQRKHVKEPYEAEQAIRRFLDDAKVMKKYMTEEYQKKRIEELKTKYIEFIESNISEELQKKYIEEITNYDINSPIT